MDKKCQACGAEAQEVFVFCPKCGAKIDEKKSCTDCGTELPDGAAFCPKCGKKAVGAAVDTATTAAVVTPQAVPQQEKAAKKPVSETTKAKIVLIRAWAVALIFALLFGLSFLPTIKVDREDFEALGVSFNDNISVPEIRITTIDLMSVMFKKPQSIDDVAQDFEDFCGNMPQFTSSQQAANYLIKKYNQFGIQRVLYTEEVLAAAPFSSRLMLFSLMIGGMLLMLGSFAAFVYALVSAILRSVAYSHGEYGGILNKKLTNIFLTAIGALTLALSVFVTGSFSPLIFWLAFIPGLCLPLLYAEEKITTRITEGRPQVRGKDRSETVRKIKNIVSCGTAAALALTMLLVFPGNAVSMKYRRSDSNRYTLTEKYDSAVAFTFIDAFIQNKSSDEIYEDYYLGEVDLATYLKDGGMDMAGLAPPYYGFFSETEAEYPGGFLVLGILGALSYLALAALAAMLFFMFLYGAVSEKNKPRRVPLLFILVCSLAMLVVDIVLAGIINSIMSQLGATVIKGGICAPPILTLIFAIGAVVQSLILFRKKESQQVTHEG